MCRPKWDQYFMDIAKVVMTRSTCIRRQVGAVIVNDKRILTTGYNGAPSKIDHCTSLNKCLREELKIPSGERLELCLAIHGEQNAIIQAAYSGVSLKGSTLYVTCMPCPICSKIIINSGISTVIYEGDYNSPDSIDMMRSAGLKVIRLSDRMRSLPNNQED